MSRVQRTRPPRVIVEVVIPYRDRGTDPLRAANLARVLEHWADFDDSAVTVATDGRDGEVQFNRSESYNRAITASAADVFVLAESDMLIDFDLIEQAITLAEKPGLVVPFTERHEHGPDDSALIRAHRAHPDECTAPVVMLKPRRTGAINVLSRETYDLVGRYDPAFEGSHWDDRSMHRAFDICAGPTRWVTGPAHHLYHLPGYEGAHLTAEDRAATAANRRRFGQYQRAKTPAQIRQLTGAQP